MPECACCDTDLEDRREQPGTKGLGFTIHYRCPGCGAGGFEVHDADGPVRTGGPAFDGWSAHAQAAADAGRDPWDMPEATPVADGGQPAEERQAAALERIADELAYQNAVLAEVVQTLDHVAGEDEQVRSARAVHTAIDDHRVTREEVEHP